MEEEISLEQLLDKKKDFSPYLVHLSKNEPSDAFFTLSAKECLDQILDEKALRAYNHFCYFSPALKEESTTLQDKFKVVCFTETPIEHIEVLLYKVKGRKFNPEPYGLIFRKEYIRAEGGNPVLYITKEIAKKPLFKILYEQHAQGNDQAPSEICKLLAFVSVCERGNDFHWEREWRIVGDLKFNLADVFCGLCPDKDTSYFEDKYSPLKFIDPIWSSKKILARVAEK